MENDGKPKRQMKSPYQLQVLEHAYAVEAHPSEAVRAELSAKIGLPDRKLQMWFSNRRLKERKFLPAKRARLEEGPSPLPPPQHVGPTSETMVAGSSSSGLFPGSGQARQAVAQGGGMTGMGKKYHEHASAPPRPPSQLSVMELRMIASVEAQLGEPLREDGPILGVEFETLPPGAFGAPIAMTPHREQPKRPYCNQMFERHDAKETKTSTYLPVTEHCHLSTSSSGKRESAAGGALVVPLCQPEQPSMRSETYERLSQSHFYDHAAVTPNTTVSFLPAGGQSVHGNKQMALSYTSRGQLSSVGCMPQQVRHQSFSLGPAESGTPQGISLANNATDAQFDMHQVVGSEDPYLSSDRRSCEDDPFRLEKKRKSEEARIQKEVEAHERRIRKDLEKQGILRSKTRKDMDINDRERRKEEERILRGKQRDEERFLREQRRENERREKLLQRETQRAEKMRQKEELQREKEAARLKAANERATARRIARGCTELIEDEHLELMELAASSKGLTSIMTLDSETLQQLDMFRDMLTAFPPKSLQLKQPFGTQPWMKSENTANFLMVWNFLITFADIIGLIPFTMDDFLQSLHDYDSKLLGEIHVALLKFIIKDIEDVARTSAMALGASQNSAANPGGGHPQIVEGAHAWGIDIRSWQRHLNFLTWPEVLRQFALAAGFGPQLKKRTIGLRDIHYDNEANDNEDVISTLRNGAAAENAVAQMHEKGYSNQRRSRYRLTPGTVKFAAYHVLCFEGSRGLTILEVAEKIQKSGLRDLTTSKTPEASISVALSRDGRLFERTAPSTYCVRAPFRKDPADADAILSAAQEKVKVFQNGLSDSDETGKYVNDAERDGDSECDVADDPKIEDAFTDTKLNMTILSSKELKDYTELTSLEKEESTVLCDEVWANARSNLISAEKSSSARLSGNSHLTSSLVAPQPVDISFHCQAAINAGVEDAKIDESNLGEPWVQGLTNGDYSDLSVEERLDALVALIGVAIEGNSIRVILEERLEAAYSLKKQMWAEAQVDKRRLKEEYVSIIQPASVANIAAEGNEALPEIINTKNKDGNTLSVSNDHVLDQHCQSNINNMPSERSLVVNEISKNLDSTSHKQYGCAVEKSLWKSCVGRKAEQYYVYRSLPLGQDRRHNRYWIFSIGPSPNEASLGKIFFESQDGLWRLVDTEEAFDALLAALDLRGIRESHLHWMLQRIEPTFKEAIRRNKKHGNSANIDGYLVKTETWASSDLVFPREIDSPSRAHCIVSSDPMEFAASFKIESGRNDMERNSISRRYKVFLRWMWKECYNPSILCAMKYGKRRCFELLHTCHLCYHCYFAEERHCPACHKTFSPMYNVGANFVEHVSHCEAKQNLDPDWICDVFHSSPIGIQLLKAQLCLMEASVPKEALQPFWNDEYRKSWGVKLHCSNSADDLLNLVTLLEGAIKRGFLSSDFETAKELCGPSTPGSVVENAISGTIPVLSWVPTSTAAVALRLLDLDASISYTMHQNSDSYKEKEAGDFINLPQRFTLSKNILQHPEGTEIPAQVDYQREMMWLPSGSGRRGFRRGTRGIGSRGRGRGGRGLMSGVGTTRAEFIGENAGNYESATRRCTKRGRTRGRGRKRGHWGRCSVSLPHAPAKEEQHGNFANVKVRVKQDSSGGSPRSSRGNELGIEERWTEYVGAEEDSSGSQSDENMLVSGDECDQNQHVRPLDDDSEDYEEDVNGPEEEDNGALIGHGLMDVDDEDEEVFGVGDANRVEEDYSSEYSD